MDKFISKIVIPTREVIIFYLPTWKWEGFLKQKKTWILVSSESIHVLDASFFFTVVKMITLMSCNETRLMEMKNNIVSKVGDLSWGWPEGSLFNSYYTEV